MTNVTVCIPFQFDVHPARDKALAFTRSHYQRHSPPVRILVGALTHDQPWSKAPATDDAFRRVDLAWTDVIVVADADCLVSHRALDQSVRVVAESGAAWSMPHRDVYRLSRSYTSAIYEGAFAPDLGLLPQRALERRPHVGPWGGGIVVTTPKAYMLTGGFDPRFTDWGGEDISWARALNTLIGPCARFHEPLWHLWHPRMERRPGNRASEANERIAALYGDADGDLAAMRDVIGGRCARV